MRRGGGGLGVKQNIPSIQVTASPTYVSTKIQSTPRNNSSYKYVIMRVDQCQHTGRLTCCVFYVYIKSQGMH